MGGMLDKSITRHVKVNIPQGLHARPAHTLVMLANSFDSEIHVIRNGESVDGKSILAILSLGAEKGTDLTIKAIGADSVKALDALEALFFDDFGEVGEEEQKTE